MSSLEEVLTLLVQLRDPEQGCDWNKKQTFQSLAPYALEEAYEVVDAIDNKSWPALKDELGDLLYQVLYHSTMAKELGYFDFETVVDGLKQKVVARHPETLPSDETEASPTKRWEQKKHQERGAGASVFDDLPSAMPALMLARKLGERASAFGLDWPDAGSVIAKLTEERIELLGALAEDNGHDQVIEELGDLLLALASFARKLGHDPELVLRQANRKFESRARYVEQRLKECAAVDVDESTVERLWSEAKSAVSET